MYILRVHGRSQVYIHLLHCYLQSSDLYMILGSENVLVFLTKTVHFQWKQAGDLLHWAITHLSTSICICTAWREILKRCASLMGLNMQWGGGGGGIQTPPLGLRNPIHISLILCKLSNKFVYIICTDILFYPQQIFQVLTQLQFVQCVSWHLWD